MTRDQLDRLLEITVPIARRVLEEQSSNAKGAAPRPDGPDALRERSTTDAPVPAA